MDEPAQTTIAPRPAASFRPQRFLLLAGSLMAGASVFAYLLSLIGAPDPYTESRTSGLWHLLAFPFGLLGEYLGFDPTFDSLPTPFSGLAMLAGATGLNFGIGMLIGMGMYLIYANLPPPPADD